LIDDGGPSGRGLEGAGHRIRASSLHRGKAMEEAGPSGRRLPYGGMNGALCMKYWRLPLDAEEQAIPVGELCILVDRCKGCGFCIEFCPNGVLVESKEFNRKGYHPPAIREQRECNHCGICEVICPEFAIYSRIRQKRCFSSGDLLPRQERRGPGGDREDR